MHAETEIVLSESLKVFMKQKTVKLNFKKKNRFFEIPKPTCFFIKKWCLRTVFASVYYIEAKNKTL
jgi:hypothetical protein